MSEILSTEIEEIEKVLERYRATGKYSEEQLERIKKSLLDAKSKKSGKVNIFYKTSDELEVIISKLKT